ncbi:MAG TPA: nuclear transport factor 2 family protein [Accumulibacter sp.]|nr:nuclear transport factor 2 family protein [Accumulibacter sp.]HMW16593.1 nuclear transport factor 2 family protein [Accumulibacter sp.]HNJ99558.1 nuclear transport factor 2 family protein [Accumulibacter sp.]HNM75792.1 nuclear transport factor 2 family protein [Accumulibacter sp.]
MRNLMHYCLSALLFLSTAVVWAATVPPLDPAGGRVEDRQALRILLDRIEKATDSLDIDGATALMHPDVIVTWQNGEVSKGNEQVRAYYNRMIKGTTPIVKAYNVKATLGGPAVFHGESAIAWGTTVESYELSDGMKFTLNANWSTTIVKKDGEWKIAALHFSTNLFDNPLLNNAERLVWIAGLAGLCAGALAAWLLLRLSRKST